MLSLSERRGPSHHIILCYLYFVICIILHYRISCYMSLWYHSILYYIVLYYTILYYIILYYVILCYIILYYIILYYIIFAANLLKKQSHVLASIANDASALSFDPGWAGCGESCFLEDEQRQTIMCTQQFCVSHSYVVHSHSFAANLLKKQSHVLASIANDASALSFDPNQVLTHLADPQNTLVIKGVGWEGCLFALLCSAVATAAAILERLLNEQLMHEKDDGKEDEGMAGLPKSMGSPPGTTL